jgi:hypothetical protein
MEADITVLSELDTVGPHDPMGPHIEQNMFEPFSAAEVVAR